jgi:hypothetical protein
MTKNTRVDDGTREAVATCRRELPDTITPPRAVLGFDGFVDNVREVVAERQTPESFESMSELATLGERITASANERSSVTVEWTGSGTRTGGHTCHLARALLGLGARPVMIGAYGEPERDIFADEFAAATRYSYGAPNDTDAVEFDDGKLLLVETGATRTLDWETLVDTVGVETIATHLDGADLFGMGYWVVIPSFPEVLTGLREDVWPTLADPPSTVLIDPGDVRQLAPDGIREGVDPLRQFADVASVTLSANRAEMRHLSSVLGASETTMAEAAAGVREAIGLERAVAHGSDESVVASERIAAVAVPHVDEPTMTTSAGDHFNVGLALGLHAGLPDPAAVCLGNVVAGVFVRTGSPPTEPAIRGFLDRYLDAFGDG